MLKFFLAPLIVNGELVVVGLLLLLCQYILLWPVMIKLYLWLYIVLENDIEMDKQQGRHLEREKYAQVVENQKCQQHLYEPHHEKA